MSQYPPDKRPPCPDCEGRERIRSRGATRCGKCRDDPGWWRSAVALTNAPPPRQDFEREWATIQKHIGMMRDRYAGPCERAVGERVKILVCSDLHAPFHDAAALAEMLERDGDADRCIVAGDLGDNFALSRFVKYEKVEYETELAAQTAVIQTLSERFPRVDILEGNHGRMRLERHLRQHLDKDFVAAILFLSGGNLSPLRAIASRFPNVNVIGHQVGDRRVDWLMTVGDAVICHAEKFSRVPSSAVRSIEEWLSDFEGVLDLSPWRVMIQAHTHQLSKLPWRAGKLLVESGCLAATQGYQLDAKIGGRPQRVGYVTLEQVNGRTDFNSVRDWNLGAEARAA